METPSGKKTIAVANPEVLQASAIKLELESFVDAIINNKQTIVSEIDGLLAMEVAHQILDKINANQRLVKQ